MFGEDGWCHKCEVPRRAQCGSLVLQARGWGSVAGAWVPHFQPDAYCLEGSLAERIAAAGFALSLLPIVWHGRPPGSAVQIVVPTIGEAWFDPDELRARTVARHGAPGKSCAECGVWRWYGLNWDQMPPYRHPTMPEDVHVAASPEWFGSGGLAFRQFIFRRELAEMIVAASPRDFKVREIPR